jgi:hypothetical protein
MLQTDGAYFKEETGRTILIRGINVGGSSKMPAYPNGASHLKEGFFDHRNVSFVGKPFPLEEADQHFTRIKAWGFNFLRFLVTWEAIEHAGPGIYDEEYLDYLVQILKKAGDYGFTVAIDPHQDCWSRFSGGDGAPGWTFDILGMDIKRFTETGAALVQNTANGPLPRLAWPSNYGKFACATMFTLFFAGNDFAPQTKVNGEPVQDFLQRHYFNTFKHLAQRLKDLPHVVGYDTINEPSNGYIGWENLGFPHGLLRIGTTPTPFQSMACASGFPQKVNVWGIGLLGIWKYRSVVLNPDGVSLWRDGTNCIWREHGVWDINKQGKPELLKSGYFSHIRGHRVDFWKDYIKPFFQKFTNEIRTVKPDAIIFYGISPQQKMPQLFGDSGSNLVNASHWYDAATLVTKNYRSWISVDYRTIRLVIGASRIQSMFAHQLSEIKKWAENNPRAVPTLVGEFGIPFDLAKKYAYRTGDFSQQEQALDTYFNAMESNLLNCALWNYSSDNSNERGDLWYEEDFSIFSRDQQKNPADIHSGGRALRAIVRPYPAKTAGEPLQFSFNMKKKVFNFKFRHDPSINAPTEIIIPSFQYPDGFQVEISDGRFEIDLSGQVLYYFHSTSHDTHHIRIFPR